LSAAAAARRWTAVATYADEGISGAKTRHGRPQLDWLKLSDGPRISGATEAAIKERLAAGTGMLKVAHELGVGSGTVQRVKREMGNRCDGG
jgi:hypothetical protein